MPPLTSSAAPEGDSRNRRQAPDREVTEVLAALRRGEPGAESQLIALVYTELRTLARRYMGRERADHTLQPTALVHEAYIRLIRDGAVDLEDRVHFFAASARVMRHILIDHARKHAAAKSPAAGQRVELKDPLAAASPQYEDILVLDGLLDELAGMEPRQARVVELMFFGGLTAAEAALHVGIGERQVKRDWKAARAWLHGRLCKKS